MIDRRNALLWVVCVALCVGFAPAAATEQSAPSGCANTLLALGDDDGIGGTGYGDDDGIGGTGVFGTVTGLGSICVNGMHIDFPLGLPVTIGAASAQASELRVGHVVWVVAHKPDAQWRAKSIAAFVASVGALDEIDRAAGRIVVDAEPIAILDAASVAPSLRTGDRVSVSGLRRPDGMLVASRVDRARPVARVEPIDLERRARQAGLEHLRIEFYFDTPRADRLRIDTTRLDEPIASGARVWLRGRVRGGILRAIEATPRVYPGDPELSDALSGEEIQRAPRIDDEAEHDRWPPWHRDQPMDRTPDHREPPEPVEMREPIEPPDLPDLPEIPEIVEIPEPPEIRDFDPPQLDLPSRR